MPTKKPKRRPYRTPLGLQEWPTSVSLTHEQIAWLETQIPPGGNRSATVREILEFVMSVGDWRHQQRKGRAS